MCLYPKLIPNRKYIPNKKNKGRPPKATDERLKTVAIGCGKCMDCMKQKRNAWKVRLMEEINTDKTGKFVTMTFSEEHLAELETEILVRHPGIPEYELENQVATLAVYRFRMRWKKRFGKALKHWLITELGHVNTERLHIHGIIFTNVRKSIVEELWKYGNVNKREKDYEDNYCSEQTVGYIVKYVNKPDKDHPNYKPKILTSPGIGSNYINTGWAKRNKYKNDETKEYYQTKSGLKIALPIYYRNKIYSENEREALWLQKLDKGDRWIAGIKVNAKNGLNEITGVFEYARELNKRLGYGDDKKDWNQIKYERQLRQQLREARHNKLYEQKHEYNGKDIRTNNKSNKIIHMDNDNTNSDCNYDILQNIRKNFENDKDNRIQQHKEIVEARLKDRYKEVEGIMIDAYTGEILNPPYPLYIRGSDTSEYKREKKEILNSQVIQDNIQMVLWTQ